MKNFMLLMLSLAMGGLGVAMLPGQPLEPPSKYVAARLQRTHFFSVWCFTKHHDCPACLTTDETSAELVRLHYDFAHVCGDSDPELAAALDVNTYPTYVAIVNGRVVGRHVGTATPRQVTDLFAKYRTDLIESAKKRRR